MTLPKITLPRGENVEIEVMPGETIKKVGYNRNPQSTSTRVRVTSSGSLVPPPPPVIVPAPPPSGYDTSFQPQSTGADETTRFENWLRGNPNRKRAVHGSIGVTYLTAVISGGSLDFLEAADIVALDDRWQATFGLYGCDTVVINDAAVEGRGYGTYHADMQWQHGIGVYGGHGVRLNRPKPLNTFGDGIDVDVMASEATPSGIVIDHPFIRRSCRNNLTLNAGQVDVIEPDFDYAGLHSVDSEPNGDREAMSIDVTITGGKMFHHDDFPVRDPGSPDIVGFALAGGGYSHAMKKRIEVRGVHADRFDVAVGFTTKFVLVDCTSDVLITQGATRFTDRNGTNEIHGNTRINLVEYPFF